MAVFKVVVLFAVLVAAVLAQEHGHGHHEYTHKPQYKYEYAVDDDHTKDHKKVQEHRDGHLTESEYKTLEADHKNVRHVKVIVDSKPHHGHH